MLETKEKNTVITIISIGLLIGIIAGFYDLINFSFYLDNIADKLEPDDKLDSIDKLQVWVSFLSINILSFAIMTLIPLLPVFFFSFFHTLRRITDHTGILIIFMWGVYSEIIFAFWGTAFINRLYLCLTIADFTSTSAFLFLMLFTASLLVFYLAYRFANIFPFSYFSFTFISLLFCLILTLSLRYFLMSGFNFYLPSGKSIFLITGILTLFLFSSAIQVYINKKDEGALNQSKPRLTLISICRSFVAVFCTMLLFANIVFFTIKPKFPGRMHSPELVQDKATANLSAGREAFNVIVILIDTLRADHMSCYGYNLNTTPTIDKFAEDGVIFTNSFSQSSWTKSSVASLFSSFYPTQHNTNLYKDILPDEVTTLSEVLKQNGYITAGFIANTNVGKKFNFQQGFDLYQSIFIKERLSQVMLDKALIAKPVIQNINFSPKIDGSVITKAASQWLIKNKDSKFFLYLHYIDPHAPYVPPDIFFKKYVNLLGDDFHDAYSNIERNEIQRALYDGEIEYADSQLEPLFKTIDNLKLKDNTLIVLLSDHGEAFLEHGNREHGNTLYNEEIKVPLIMRLPGYLPAGKKISYHVSTIDIMPTILNILDIRYNDSMEGENLYPIMNNEPDKERDYLFLEEPVQNGSYFLYALIKGEYKYYMSSMPETKGAKFAWREEKLLNLGKDPEEYYNFRKLDPIMTETLREEFLRIHNHTRTTQIRSVKTVIDKSTREELKALGYIQ